MPIEIKELVIRAVASTDKTNVPQAKSPAPQATRASRENMEQIIQECVQQVLRILERNEER